MLNKIYSFLILVGFFGFGYMYYNFEYKPKQILKQQEELKQEQEKLVEKKEVSLNEVVKEIKTENSQTNVANKIEELKQKNNSYIIFELENLGIFSFVELENNNIGLYKSGEKLGEYEKVDKNKLDIKEIIGNNNYFYLQIGDSRFLYDLSLKKLNKFDLNVQIEYIKSGKTNMQLLFKTNVGIFVYSLINNNFEYFNFFSDFIYYNNGYLGIISKDDKTRLNNLGINNDGNNLIIYYNPNTKEKRVVYNTKLELIKIYKINDRIYFKDLENKEYELENLE